jgi:hypothetical protein
VCLHELAHSTAVDERAVREIEDQPRLATISNCADAPMVRVTDRSGRTTSRRAGLPANPRFAHSATHDACESPSRLPGDSPMGAVLMVCGTCPPLFTIPTRPARTTNLSELEMIERTARAYRFAFREPTIEHAGATRQVVRCGGVGIACHLRVDRTSVETATRHESYDRCAREHRDGDFGKRVRVGL